MSLKYYQIWISYFFRNFYEVNSILVLTQIHWMNFDRGKILFTFYYSNFKAMTFSVCSGADQNISDSLMSSSSQRNWNALSHCMHSAQPWLNVLQKSLFIGLGSRSRDHDPFLLPKRVVTRSKGCFHLIHGQGTVGRFTT